MPFYLCKCIKSHLFNYLFPLLRLISHTPKKKSSDFEKKQQGLHPLVHFEEKGVEREGNLDHWRPWNPETVRLLKTNYPIWTFWRPFSPMRSPAEPRSDLPPPFLGPTSETKTPWRSLILPSTPTSIRPRSWTWLPAGYRAESGPSLRGPLRDREKPHLPSFGTLRPPGRL